MRELASESGAAGFARPADRVFLKLGTIGFGGPVALVGYM